MSRNRDMTDIQDEDNLSDNDDVWTEEFMEQNLPDTYSQEPPEFFFESDHLALRGNSDYQNLLRAYVILCAQENQMLKNYDILNSALKLSQEKPLEFVQNFRSGALKLPELITPIDIPKIDLQKYENRVPEKLLAKAKNIYQSCKNNEDASKDIKTVTQLKDIQQPDKSHKLWTVAEQRRLEELLIEYPPEDVEMRRFAKIAKALGNRTTKQVASRLQKYFLKLHKAGLPIPGRMPRARVGKGRSKNSVFSGSYSLMRPSTFFPSLNIPSGLQELKNQDMRNVRNQSSYENSSDTSNIMDDEVTESESNSDDSMSDSDNMTIEKSLLHLIKRVFKDKQKDDSRPSSIHMGYCCDSCKETPILGTRWHCMDCVNSMNFCSDCLIAQTETPENLTHPLSHNLVPFRCKPQNSEQCDIKVENPIRKSGSSENLIKDEPCEELPKYKINQKVEDDEYIHFTQQTESMYMEHLADLFRHKKINSQTYLEEMLSLNFGQGQLKIDMGDNEITDSTVSEFFKDKTVLNVVRSPDLHDRFFAKFDSAIDGISLQENEKKILSSHLDLNRRIVKKELLDHDYSISMNFIKEEIKEETVKNEFYILDVKSEYPDNHDLGLNLQIHDRDLFNIGREEFL